MQSKAGQIFDDFVTGLVSVIRILRHHLVDDQIQTFRISERNVLAWGRLLFLFRG